MAVAEFESLVRLLVAGCAMKKNVLVAVLAPFVFASAAAAYLQIGIATPNGVVAAKWSQMPIRYFITNRGVPGVTAAQLQTACRRRSTPGTTSRRWCCPRHLPVSRPPSLRPAIR